MSFSDTTIWSLPSIRDILDNAKADNEYVLLMTASDISPIKERLKKTIGREKLKRVIINFGHRTSTDYYEDIHLVSSVDIYIVGNRSLPSHDAVNIECVDSIQCYLEKFKGKKLPQRITCVFEDLDTYEAFKTSEIFQKVTKGLGIEFVPYNFYTGWVKHVFINQYHKGRENNKEVSIAYPSVFGDGITSDDERHVHLVFVGFSFFSVAFALEAAKVLHFPNFKNGKHRIRITFIDINADKEKDEFITRNRHFFEIQAYRSFCRLTQGYFVSIGQISG